MIGYSKEEIRDKVQTIAEGMDNKAEQVKKLKASLLFDRGRLEELKNMYNLMIAAEEKAAEEKPKKKAPAKRKK